MRDFDQNSAEVSQSPKVEISEISRGAVFGADDLERHHERPILEMAVLVIARNAEQCLPELLRDLEEQTLDSSKFEIVLVDSISSDSTLAIMEDFGRRHLSRRIQILNNTRCILASGWNLAIQSSVAPIVVRLDAHSRIPSDFLAKNLEVLAEGHDIVGGRRYSVSGGGIGATLMHKLETSPFGAGGAAYRRKIEAGYVDTLAHAAYRRTVFAKVNWFNERMARTEDNIMHRQLHDAGFRFWFDPRISSSHHVRNSLSKMLKQKFGNGYWVGRSSIAYPRAFGARHFAPAAFSLGVIVSVGLLAAGKSATLVFAGMLYILASFAAGVAAFSAGPGKYCWCMFVMPFLFFLVHFSYGVGTISGMLAATVADKSTN